MTHTQSCVLRCAMQCVTNVPDGKRKTKERSRWLKVHLSHVVRTLEHARHRRGTSTELYIYTYMTCNSVIEARDTHAVLTPAAGDHKDNSPRRHLKSC